MTKIKALIMVLVLVGISACSNDIKVNVNFSQAQSVSKNDPVWFNGQKIGQVKSINNDIGTQAELALDPELITPIFASAAAMITEIPEHGIEILNAKSGSPIAEGAQLKGLNNAFEVTAWTAGTAMGSLNELFSSAAGALNAFLNGKEFDGLSQQLQQSLQQMSQDSSGALNGIVSNFAQVMQQFESQSLEFKKQAQVLSEQLAKTMEEFQRKGEAGAATMLKDLQKELDAAIQQGESQPFQPIDPNQNNTQDPSMSEEDKGIKL